MSIAQKDERCCLLRAHLHCLHMHMSMCLCTVRKCRCIMCGEHGVADRAGQHAVAVVVGVALVARLRVACIVKGGEIGGFGGG